MLHVFLVYYNAWQSRPPGIYKPGYLQVLADRLNGGSIADVMVPQRPDWCSQEENSETEYCSKKNRKNFQNDVSIEYQRNIN